MAGTGPPVGVLRVVARFKDMAMQMTKNFFRGSAKAGHRGLHPATAEAERLARKLLTAKALPRAAEADAYHVAVAAAGGANFLLTWNCRHIANPETLPIIHRIIVQAGVDVPVITTPGFMLESRNEN